MEESTIALKLRELRSRCRECLTILNDASSDPSWKVAVNYFGIETSYKEDPDGSIWIKLDGEIEGVPLFEQLAVVRETQLFKHWAPFCNRSELIS